jgi:hypothetical protein
VASDHLRVTRIFDLDPVRARAVGMVATARELAYDALEIVRTRDLEEVPPACFEVVHVQQPRVVVSSFDFLTGAHHLNRRSAHPASRKGIAATMNQKANAEPNESKSNPSFQKNRKARTSQNAPMASNIDPTILRAVTGSINNRDCSLG